MVDIWIASMNGAREKNGFMTIEQIFEIAYENQVYDVFSLLISKNVIIGKGNTFYPNCMIECKKGRISIGDFNTICNGTTMRVINSILEIGDNNEIGENGLSITTVKGKTVVMNQCRLKNNAQILDNCYIGNGAQVLGNIKMSECILENGASYKEINPNNRGGVIKGYGTALNLVVKAGEVLSGTGIMTNDMIERQEKYHPDWRNEEPT